MSSLLDELFKWAAGQPSGNTTTVMCTITTTQSLSSTNETDDIVTYAQGLLTYNPLAKIPDTEQWVQPSFAGTLQRSFSNRTAVAFHFDFQAIPFIRGSTYLFNPNNTDGLNVYIASGGYTPTPNPPPVYSIAWADLTNGDGDEATPQYTSQVIYGVGLTGQVITIALGAQSSM